jgi:hypothetical protein
MDQEKTVKANSDPVGVTDKPGLSPTASAVKKAGEPTPLLKAEPSKDSAKAAPKKELAKKAKVLDFRSSSNEAFVKRRKRKRVALAVLTVCSVGVFTLGLVSFLGDYSGNFTVKMDNKRADLTMGVDADFNRKTTYLRGVGLENASCIQASDLPTVDKLDSEPFGEKVGTRTSTLRPDFAYSTYLAYTFLVKNVSPDPTSFAVEFNIDSYINSTNNAAALQDLARVRIFENLVTADGNATHHCNTYARKSATPFTRSDGSLETRECISDYRFGSDGITRVPASTLREEDRGFATEFITDNNICKYVYSNLPSNAVLRYTVCVWLEGWDPDCKGPVPDNASMTFSMHFEVL